MTQHSMMFGILDQKLQWIKDQTKQLHKVADNLCNKVFEETTEVLKNTDTNKNQLREINLKLDGLFDFLTEKCRLIDDAAHDGFFENGKVVNEACEPQLSSFKMNKRYSEAETIKIVNRLEVLEEAVSSLRSGQQHLSMLQVESEKKLTTKFHGIDNESQQIQERLKNCEEMGKNISTDLTTLIYIPIVLKNIQNETQEMAQKIEQQEAKLTEILQFNVVIQTNKMSIDDLVLKAERLCISLSDLSSFQEKERERLSKIKNELTTVQTFVSINKTDLDQKLKAITEQYELMKHVLLKKVENLERLREILNLNSQSKRSKKTVVQSLDAGVEEFQCKQDSPLSCELRLIKQRILGLENRYIFAPVGFTAYLDETIAVKKGEFLTSYLKNVTFNPGNHFDQETCRFTAPIDGMYLIALTLWQRNKGKIGVKIRKSLHYPGLITGTEKPENIGKVFTESANTSSCGVCLTHMREGDTIDVCIIQLVGIPLLSSATCLTCFLV
ncbi:unnamed protein product [Lymnaea stagnalis]|uniref:C1q domain-containing protein n=1 Tax=Lymnaea stagnalis TaxID=6523 RepID=A0AAV2HYD3_LYMST